MNKTSPEEFRNDNIAYPPKHIAGSEEIYDSEVYPAVLHAHDLAARAGIPILTVASYSLEGDAVHALVKSFDAVSFPVLLAWLIVTANHPRHTEMVVAAVRASQDEMLAEKYTDHMALVLGIDVVGMKPRQKAHAVATALMQTQTQEQEQDQQNPN